MKQSLHIVDSWLPRTETFIWQTLRKLLPWQKPKQSHWLKRKPPKAKKPPQPTWRKPSVDD